MQEKDIQGILQKVEELKAVFTFGVRFVPFLEDLLMFVQEMAPMLNEMSKSIAESSSKMPKAVQQLDKVTSATEMATHEILDKVEDMLNKLEGITTSFQTVSQRLEAESRTIAEITSDIEALLKLPKARKRLSEIFEDKKARDLGVKIKNTVDTFLAEKVDDSISGQVGQLLQDVQTDAFDIMNALQVQDITSQQIEGAHAMLRSIQERLNGLITKYSDAEPPAVIRESKAFDAEASFEGGEERQKLVDEVMGGEPAEESAVVVADEERPVEDGVAESQADIDALFSSGQTEAGSQGEKPASSAFDEHLMAAGPAEFPAAAGEEAAEMTLDEELAAGEVAGEEETGEVLESLDQSVEELLGGSAEESGPADPFAAAEKLEAAELETAPAQEALETEAYPETVEETAEPAEKAGKPDDKAGKKKNKAGSDDSLAEKEMEGQISITQEEIDKLFQ